MKDVVVLLGDPRKYDIVKLKNRFNLEDIETIEKLKETLFEIKNYKFSYLDDHGSLFEDLMNLKNSGKIDYAFNLCDEGFNNDPRKEAFIPFELERLGILYTGAGVNCLETCYDKELVRKIAENFGIDIPKKFNINDFIFPIIVKPSEGDGGFGITQKSVVKNKEELGVAISLLEKEFSYKGKIILEEFLCGDEITIGIIGNPPTHIFLPIIQEDYSALPKEFPMICGYEAKWDPESEYWKSLKSISIKLLEETEKIIKENSLKLFERLGCRDYARFDWRFDWRFNCRLPKFLEVNPNPGWSWDGHLAKAAKNGGISYSRMLEMILKSAEKRFDLL